MSEWFPVYFSEEELESLQAQEGKRLHMAHYIVWQNLTANGEQFEALDWIELHWTDGSTVAFHADADTDAIRIRPLNFGLEQTRVLQEFGRQARLERIDMSLSPVWAPVIGRRLSGIGLDEFDAGLFRSELLQLGFEGLQIEIARDTEGLLARQV
ncbi:MAG: hypothetical protein NW241_19175 [Bacteroidia bacterium]|nr:hypothetical protein [Bacteroidia bacterium]